MGQLTQTTAQVQVILDDADAANVGKTSLTDGSDTTSVAFKKSGFYSLQGSSANAPSTDRAVLISAVRDTAATGEIRYGQIAITESNGLWWNRDDGGSLGTWYEAVTTTSAQTLTNKTLTSPILTTPQINDSAADHQYIFAGSNLAADRTVTLPLLTGDDTFVFAAHTQTLTNKTLTTPTVSGLTLSDASIIFEGATANDYETTLTVTDPTADRTITLPNATDTLVGRATTDTLTNKTLTSPVASGLTLSDASIVFEGATADAHETTLTVTDPTADRIITLPNATDTLVGLATTDTLTNKTLTSPVLNTGVSGTAVLDADDFTGASATKLASSESIKAYVDSQVGSFDTLSEVLAAGNTTGSNDIAVDTTQKVQFRDAAIYVNSSADGQLDIVADTTVQIDSGGTITLDAETDGQVAFKDGGTQYGLISKAVDNLILKSSVVDGDVIIQGTDSGGTVTAATFDMSNSGQASFNAGATFGGNVDVTGAVTADGLTVEADSGGGGGSTTPVVAVISDTDGGGSWVSGTIFAATDYKSGDGSGAGSGVRVRTGIAQEASSGATSSYIVQTAPTTAGTMLDRLKISSGGDISFYEDTGTTAKLFWDASAESLGIGTSSPAQPLEILKTSSAAVVPMIQLRNGSSSAGSGTAIKFMHSTASNATSGTCELESIRYSGNLGALTFKTSNNGGTVTERMRVDDTGVGVGTDSPSSILHLSTSDDPKITLTDTGFGASADITGSNGNLRLNSQTATIFDMADSEIARFDSSGNFLVGKTSTTFSVAGVENRADGRITSTRSGNTNLLLNRLSSDGDIVQFYKDGTTVGSIGTLSSALTIGTGDTGIQFNADNNAVMPHNITTGANVDNSIDIGYSSGGTNRRFKDLYLSGNAFIGNAVTSSTDGSSDLKLEGNQHIFRRGSAGSYAEQARIDSSGNLVLGDTGVIRANSQIGVSVEAAGRIYMSRGTSTGGFSHLAFYNGNGQVGTVSSSGSATAYNTSSDQRLKDNIVNAPSASDDIDAIQVRSFDWKINGSHQKYGMVAQELQSVAPEAVSAPEDPEEMMGVDYSKLVPMLVKEIQSLRARVAQLES